MIELERPVVSVCMITYNHEKYIAQAIESVLMQETNFKYELVIGEDCSTDDTRYIVRAYGERYPEQIRLLLPERNQGMIANFVSTLNVCRGQYIALLEGDDYWTDPLKLQKQVDFLEEHKECVICFHDAKVIHEDGSKESHSYLPAGQKVISTLDDLLVSNFIPTCSVFFRNGLIKEFPEWYYELKMGDWPLHILNAKHGKIGYINNEMAVRRYSSGIHSSMDEISKIEFSLHAREIVYKNDNTMSKKILGEYIFNHSYILADKYKMKGDSTRSKIYLLKCLGYIQYNKKISWKSLVKLLKCV